MASFTAHYTLHITPCTVHPAQCTLHCTLHIACTMHHGRLPGHLCPLPHQAPRLWPRLTALVRSAPAAFIEATERSVSAFSGEEGVCRKLEHLMGPGARGAVLEGPAGLKHPHRGGVQSCLGPPTEGGSPVQHLLGPMGKELER